ncbi:MAG: MATE family efflux transporter [Clostridia bacterium]|nr:MATE family efflux transporter [Clostridia bacterium]
MILAKKRVKREMDMLNGPLFGKIMAFSFSLMLTNVLQLLYNAADLMIIGQFSGSDTAVAAVGATTMIVNLILNLFIGLSVGVSVLVARGYGTGNRDATEKAIHTAMALAIISGFSVLVIGMVLSKSFLVWMNTSPAIIDQSALYLRVYFFGAPFNMVYNFGAAILRAKGDTKRPLYFLSLSGLVNVILNFVFVYFLHMDVAGVALATVISQIISAVLIVMSLRRQDGMCRLHIRKLRIHQDSLLQIIRVGLPASIQNMLFSISAILIQSSVNSFDIPFAHLGKAPYTSGSAAANTIESFLYTSLNSFYHAAMNFTGQNYAARKYNRVRKVMYTCMLGALCVGIALSTLILGFGKPLLSIYIPGDLEAIEYGYQRLWILCPIYFMCGIMEITSGQLRGLGKSLVPMCISVIGICGFRVFWIYTVFAINHDWSVLFLSYPVSWILTSAAQYLCCYIAQKKMPKTDMPSEEIAPIAA